MVRMQLKTVCMEKQYARNSPFCNEKYAKMAYVKHVSNGWNALEAGVGGRKHFLN